MAKTKALISFAVLICVFVFAYAKSRFSHDAAFLYRDLDFKIFRALEQSGGDPFFFQLTLGFNHYT